MKALLVEDDHMIGQAIAQSLKESAYAVDWVLDGQAALTALDSHDYDIVILDLGLPKKTGTEVLRSARRKSIAVPIIVVTARDSVDHRIQSLDEGADDYVTKPFEMQELLARMRAVVRRKAGTANPIMSNGILFLNPATREASVNAVSVRLSAREFSLLHALLIRPGAILSRADLEERVYGWNEEVESNAIEFLIHSLRKKLGSDHIKNVRGLGWMVSKIK